MSKEVAGMDIQERIYDLLAPVIATLDVELLDVEFNGGTLRVIIDSPDDGRVTTGRLA